MHGSVNIPQSNSYTKYCSGVLPAERAQTPTAMFDCNKLVQCAETRQMLVVSGGDK